MNLFAWENEGPYDREELTDEEWAEVVEKSIRVAEDYEEDEDFYE